MLICGDGRRDREVERRSGRLHSGRRPVEPTSPSCGSHAADRSLRFRAGTLTARRSRRSCARSPRCRPSSDYSGPSRRGASDARSWRPGLTHRPRQVRPGEQQEIPSVPSGRRGLSPRRRGPPVGCPDRSRRPSSAQTLLDLRIAACRAQSAPVATVEPGTPGHLDHQYRLGTHRRHKRLIGPIIAITAQRPFP